MNEAQKTLYHIAENMRMEKSISKEGYEHFQMAIKALEQEEKEPDFWIKDNDKKVITCSKCKTWFNLDDRLPYMRHCPYCATEMIEEGGAV